VIHGKTGKFLSCLLPGRDDKTTQVNVDRQQIAPQCCSSTDGTCTRFIDSNDDSGCLAGFSDTKDAPSYLTPFTYGQTAALCASLDLTLCNQSCVDTGCAYNYHPVYSNLPCPEPPPPPPLSPPPIPELGIAILAGDSDNVASFCLWPGDEAVTSAVGRAEWPNPLRSGIAAQCCTSGEQLSPIGCRRKAKPDGSPSTSDDDCIAGVLDLRPSAPPSTFKNMTYGDTVAKCASLNLVLCLQSCSGTGCAYNGHPVYSDLPCPFDRLPQ